MKKKRSCKREGSHGAVTVFLTLILVPCIVFTCAFGDVSRVALSKSQATAASDLAMYSLMANYDTQLKEWYGLVASCQDIDEFYDTTKDYFVGMMDAEGLDGTASSTIVSYLDAVKNEDFTDFLQVDGIDSTKVGPVANGAMGGNPALIEDGIVEFMKYRGPVEIVSNLLDRFRDMDFSELLEADENQPIVEAKQEYAQAEGEMMEDLFYTYLAIQEYVNYQAETGVPSLDKFQNSYGERLSQINHDLELVTEVITKYYAATAGIKNLSTSDSYGGFPQYTLPDSNLLNNECTAILYNGYTYTMDDIGAQETDEENVYEISESALNTLISGIDNHIGRIESAAANIANACSGIETPSSGAGNDVNDAVYCMRVQTVINSSDLNTVNQDGKSLMQIYAKLLLARCCTLPESSDGTAWGQKIQNELAKIQPIHTNYLSYTSPSTAYETLLSNYKRVADSTVNPVTGRTYEFLSQYCSGNMTVGGFFEAVRNEFGDLIGQLTTQIGNLDRVLNGGKLTYPASGGSTYTVVSLDTLKKEIIAYSNARDKWGSAANSSHTDYATAEQAEYNGTAEKNNLSAALYADGAESVEILRTRLTNIQRDMQALKDALSNFTYGGQQVFTLSRESAIEAAKTVVPSTVDSSQASHIRAHYSENEQDAKTYASQLISLANYTPPTRTAGEAGNDPVLANDPPALYRYMKDALINKNPEDIAKAKDDHEKESDECKEKAEEAKEKSKGFDSDFLNDLGIDPKECDGTGSFNIGTVLTGLIGAVETVTAGNFDEFRDQIYVCEYAMDMFSYSSYNNEGQYHLAGEPLTLDQYNRSAHAFTEYEEKWKETAPDKFMENKSLTNRMINSDYNRSNLAEVEFILYGKGTNQENLEAAYGNIFTIRESLNLISGFVNFWGRTTTTGTNINAIADALAVTTAGFVPAPLTKVLLIGLLATMETAHDMDRLKAGIPVTIYKQKEENWVYRLDVKKMAGIFSGNAEDVTDENGLFYSDYLYLFLMIAANDTELYKSMLLRISDLVEGNMEKGSQKSFDLEKSQCYFQLTSTVRVKPLLLTLPIVSNYDGADSSSLIENTDWCTYKLSVIRGYS